MSYLGTMTSSFCNKEQRGKSVEQGAKMRVPGTEEKLDNAKTKNKT
jgi:hypothetical protein